VCVSSAKVLNPWLGEGVYYATCPPANGIVPRSFSAGSTGHPGILGPIRHKTSYRDRPSPLGQRIHAGRPRADHYPGTTTSSPPALSAHASASPPALPAPPKLKFVSVSPRSSPHAHKHRLDHGARTWRPRRQGARMIFRLCKMEIARDQCAVGRPTVAVASMRFPSARSVRAWFIV